MDEPTCSIDGCEDPARIKGLCKKHYDKQYYQRTRDYARVQRRAWYERNAEAVKAKARAAYQASPEVFKARTRAYKEKNPDRVSAYWVRRYAQNRDEQLAAAKVYYQQNKAAAKRRARDWANANPEQRKAIQRRYKKTDRGRLIDLAGVHLRNGRKRGAAGHASYEQLVARWAYYGGRCWMCPDPADEWDHVIALARGGSNWPSNLRPACGDCNRKKGHRPYVAAVE